MEWNWVLTDPRRWYSINGKQPYMLYPRVSGNAVPKHPVVSSWHFADGRHRRGDGPFFVASCSASAGRASLVQQGWSYDEEMPISSCGRVYFDTDGWAGLTHICEEAYIGYVDGVQCLCEVGVQNTDSAYLGSFWSYYPLIWEKTESPERPAYYGDYLYGKTAYWTPPLPGSLQGYEHQDQAVSWLKDNLSSGWSSQSTSILLTRALCYPGTRTYDANLADIGLMHGEYGFWLDRVYTMPGLCGSSDLHAGLFTEAYNKAADHLPQLTQNTIANVIECAKTVVSFMDGFDRGDITRASKTLKGAKDLAADTWLKYRYMYSTTVSDLTEVTEAVQRLATLEDSEQDRTISSYGSAKDSTGTFHCCIRATIRNVIKSRKDSPLRTLGLAPSLANAWDLVPFSFMVDWVTQLNKVLEGIDSWLYQPDIADSELWYSYTNSYRNSAGRTVKVFFRFQGGRPLLPYWRYTSASSKTTAMRVTDTVSLLPLI